MAGDGKNIKFSFELDNQSFSRVKQAIKDLTQELGKMNQAGGGLFGGGNIFSGVSVGGQAPSKEKQQQAGANKSGGQQQVGKIILDNAKAFKDFANQGKEASKTMTDAIKKDLEVQTRQLNALNESLQKVLNSYRQLGGKGGYNASNTSSTGGGGGYSYSYGSGSGGGTTTGGGNNGGGGPGVPGAGPTSGGGPKGGGGFMDSLLGPGVMNKMRQFRGGIGVAGLVDTLKWGADEAEEGGLGIFSGNNDYGQGLMDTRAMSKRGRMLENRVRALRKGDFTHQLLREYIDNDTSSRNAYGALNGALGEYKAGKKGTSNMVASIPLAGGLLQSMGIVGTKEEGMTMFEGFSTAQQQNVIQQAIQKFEGDKSQELGFLDTKMGFENWQSTVGERSSFNRSGIGMYQRKDANGKVIAPSYRDITTWSAQNAVDPSQWLGNYNSLRQMGIGGLAKNATLAQAAGISGYESLAAAANRGAPNAATADYLARAAVGGGINVGAGMQIGRSIFGYDPRGTTSGEGMMAAIQSGFNFRGMSTGQQFNVAESLPGAIQGLDALTSGRADNYALGTNTLSAKRILGKGADTRGVDYLATMGLKQMVDIGFGKGKMTDQMDVYGINRQQVAQSLREKLASALGPETNSKALGGVATKVRDALLAGKNPNEINLNAKEKKILNVALGDRANVPTEIADAMGGLFGGIGAKGKGKKGSLLTGGFGGGLTGPQKDAADRAAESEKQIQDSVDRLNGSEKDNKIGKRIRDTKGEEKSTMKFGTDTGALVSDFNEQLSRLTGILKQNNDILDKSGWKGKVSGPAKQQQEEGRVGHAI